jgi:hypothetical protein
MNSIFAQEIKTNPVASLDQTKILKNKDFEIVFGSYTYHYMGRDGVSKAFKNKVSSDGKLIANPTIGASYRRYKSNLFHADTFVFLKDSIGSDAFGYLRSFGGKNKDNWHAGIIGGSYLINKKRWEEAGYKPPLRIRVNSVYTLIPVIGLQISKRFELPNDHFISFNNIFTLYVTNHTFSIGKSF